MAFRAAPITTRRSLLGDEISIRPPIGMFKKLMVAAKDSNQRCMLYFMLFRHEDTPKPVHNPRIRYRKLSGM